MFAAFGWYTTLVVCLNVVATGGGSNLFPLEQFSTFTPADIEERIKGSKIVVVSEQAMLNTIYSIKACMLIMYMRLTLGLRQQNMVKAIAIYVACGWVGTELAFFFACRPFNGYWAVPPPNPQCTTLQHYAVAQASFNISSDLLMLGIMLPILSQVNLPTKQKVALILLFGMGSFVILAAILTKVFNLSDVYSPIYMLWYIREASVAMYVANLPMLWPLLRVWFPYLRKTTSGIRSLSTNRKSGAMAKKLGATADEKGSISMSHVSKSKRNKSYNMGIETDIERSDSAQRINKLPFGSHGILTETTVEIDIDELTPSVEDLDLENNLGQIRPHERDRTHFEWGKA